MTGRPPLLHSDLVVDDGNGGVRTTTVHDELIRLAQTGAKPGIISDCVGISRHTLMNWLKWGNPDWMPETDRDTEIVPADRSPYFDFFNKWRVARGRPAMVAEASWMRSARDGDWRAAKAWLEAHRPDEFTDDQHVHHHGQVGVVHDIAKVLDDYAGAFDDDDDASQTDAS